MRGGVLRLEGSYGAPGALRTENAALVEVVYRRIGVDRPYSR